MTDIKNDRIDDKKKEQIKEDLKKSFGVMLNRAKKFHTLQPYFYDKNRIWWLWDKSRCCYEQIDQIDILNCISDSLAGPDYIESKTKNMILEALKRYGRNKIPKNPNKRLVQFNSQIVDFSTGHITLATPEYFFTNPIPWDIGESENTPNIDRIFTQWVGEKYVDTLYEIIAYCILSDYPIHRIICLEGAGSNGKTKFLNLIVKFIGAENNTSTELDLLLNSRFEPAKLYRKLVCTIGETSINSMKRTSVIKRLTGQDEMGFEFKNKDPFSDHNYAKIIMATNSLPVTYDRSIGFYRRWLIIQFPNQFTEKIDILSQIPEQEYNNLARKCIRILRELLERKTFTNEKNLLDRKKEYEEISNPLIGFIRKKCVKGPNKEIAFPKFYAEFVAYLQEHNKRVITKNETTKLLNMLGYDKQRKNRRLEEGLCTTEWCILGLDIGDNTTNTIITDFSSSLEN